MKVTLKPEIERVIAKEVESGRSTNPDEFLDKAVDPVEGLRAE